MAEKDRDNRSMVILLVIIVVGALAWGVLSMPDKRTSGEKVGDAIGALPQGAGEAAEELGNRTPAERMGDAVDDATEQMQDNTNTQ